MTDHPPWKGLNLRFATMNDIEDITDVAQQGFPDDPEFNYRFPFRHDYPEDNRTWVRKEYKEYLEQPKKYDVVIITADDNGDKAVALSVWDISISTPHKGGDLGIPDDSTEKPRRKDVNPAHFRQFKKRMDTEFDTYFSRYGDDQIHLWLLCTIPSFRRRGAGTRLCRWGLDLAQSRSAHVTVLASPMGRALYEEIGFKLDGFFIVREGKEPEHLNMWALTYHKTSSPMSGSWLVQQLGAWLFKNCFFPVAEIACNESNEVTKAGL